MSRRATRTTRRLERPAERMVDIVPPAPPAHPLRHGHPVAPWDGVARSRTVTTRLDADIVAIGVAP